MTTHKHEYRPTQTTGGFLLSLFMVTFMTSLWSRGAYESRADAENFLFIAAMCTIFGNFVYYVMTSIPIAMQLLRDRGYLRKNNTDSSDKTQKNTQYFVSNVKYFLDVYSKEGLSQYTMSRPIFWYISSSFSLGLFVLYIIIPGYDVGCNVSFCAGMNAEAIVDEVFRGRAWKREKSRQVLMVVTVVAGMIVNALEFALSYIALAHSRKNDPYVESMLLNRILQNNSSSAVVGSAGQGTNGSVIVIDVHEFEYYVQKAGETNMQLRMLLWTSCFFGARFLRTGLLPCSKIGHVLEMSRPGTSSVAGVVVLFILLQSNVSPMHAVSVSNVLGSLYIFFSGFFVTTVAMFIMRLLQQRRTLYVTFIIQLECLFLLVAHHGLSMDLPIVRHTFAALLCFLVLFVVLCIWFIRAENIAIRQGWAQGSHFEQDFEDDEMGLSTDNFSITDVLDTVEREVENNEKTVLLHGKNEKTNDEENSEVGVKKMSSIPEVEEGEGKMASQ